MKTIADALGAARSNLAVQASAALPARRRGRPAKPETELLSEIEQIIAGQPSYGYRRVHALIRRCRHEQGGAAVNVKHVYRIMTVKSDRRCEDMLAQPMQFHYQERGSSEDLSTWSQ